MYKKTGTLLLIPAVYISACVFSPNSLNESLPKSSDAQFSAKAVSVTYLKRKVEKFISDNRGDKLVKEINYARIKHPQTLRNVTQDNPAVFNNIENNTAVRDRARDDSVFAAYVNTLRPLPAGAVSWWRGEDNSNDEVGPNHGTMQNGATFAAGRIGRAFSLDGVNDFIRINNPDIIGPTTNTSTLTISAWINLSTYPQYQAPIFMESYPPAGHTRNYLLISNDKRVYYDQYFPNSNYQSSNSEIQLNTWYHLAIVQNGSNRKIFINGVNNNEDNTAETYSGNAPTQSVIGSYPFGGNAYYFHGLIDELAVWKRALTNTEVQQIFAAAP